MRKLAIGDNGGGEHPGAEPRRDDAAIEAKSAQSGEIHRWHMIERGCAKLVTLFGCENMKRLPAALPEEFRYPVGNKSQFTNDQRVLFP
jgi:hypothetical protein